VSDALYAGIDAGGTATRCVVADRCGVVLGSGRSGVGNALIGGSAVALDSYRRALDAAIESEHRDAPLAHLHLAVAGTVVPEGVVGMAAAVTVSNDTAAAFAGALVDGPGLIAIAGTGSACYGEAADGRTALFGGWGPLLGDEGSGYAIGRQALARLALAVEGQIAHTPLTEALLPRVGAQDRPTLQRAVYDPPMPREDIAALAQLVAECAAGGDALARLLLDEAGGALGRTAGALAAALELRGEQARTATLGGVFGAGESFLVPFVRELRRLAPGAPVVVARFPPVVGALILSYRGAGIPVDAPLLAALSASLAGWEWAEASG